MSKNAILTVNLNGALCENSRGSMQAAAQRWGADYVEVDEGFFSAKPGPAVSPAALKCFCFELTDRDAYFVLDADTLVSAECPNPFVVFPGPELVAVSNGSARFPDLVQILGCEFFEWAKLAAEEPRLAGAQYQIGGYFNTGMMLLKRRAHAEMFRLVSDVVKADHGLGWNDQTPINMAAVALAVKVWLVDERWNYIHPRTLGGGWLKMRSTGQYIYHGAGEPSRNEWLNRADWR